MPFLLILEVFSPGSMPLKITENPGKNTPSRTIAAMAALEKGGGADGCRTERGLYLRERHGIAAVCFGVDFTRPKI
jgi:hypothetical protein